MPAPLRPALRGLIDFFLPPRCQSCGHPGAVLCNSCLSRVIWLRPPVCRRCGRPQPGETCQACIATPPAVGAIRAVAVYAEPVRGWIHALKYANRFGLAGELGGLMVERWSAWAPTLPRPDRVVPVPLHQARQAARGYNQAALLARAFAAGTNLPVAGGALVRRRVTQPQAALPARDRQENVRGAFAADPATIAGFHVLLVDDVCTTGATLSAAAAALLAAGAASVSAYCLARVT